MTIALSLLALLAIAAAIGAASRVQRQLAAAATQTKPGQISEKALVGSLQERQFPEAQQPQMESDRDRDQVFTPSSSASEAKEPIVDTSKLLIEVPLATSLTVTEVLHPAEVEVSLQFGRALEEPSETVAHVNLLNELDELDHSDHHGQIAHLSRYVEHSDGVMRAAAAFALGELLAKSDRFEVEEISALLHQFSQDANPQVRLQAVNAFNKMQLS